MLAPVTLSRAMSLAEFLAWEPAAGQRWQLVDGQPQAMAPASFTHSALHTQVGHLLAAHFERRGGTCIALVEPGLRPPASSANNYRIPDLAVTCSPQDRRDGVLARPVVIVEILSLSNHAETWNNIWAYTSFPSLAEVLILYSDRVGGALLRRCADGTWPDAAEPLGETLVLDSLGFSAPLAALYRTTALS